MDDDLRDLIAFLMEFNRETDRGLALVSAAIIDEKLAEILEAFFHSEGGIAKRILGLDSQQAPLSSFSARADAALALGLIDQHEYDNIAIIRRVRNQFAHSRAGIAFETPEIAKLCLKLKSVPAGIANRVARKSFNFAMIEICMRLHDRSKHAAKERRASKEWVSPGRVTWSVDADWTAIALTLDNGETFAVDLGGMPGGPG